ncbi:hypothetical protein HGRIS_004442 [Hohenbuehelia grisea]
MSKGCFTDSGARTLAAASHESDNMTPKKCIDYCSSYGFTYAGVEWSRECFCDYAIQSPGEQAKAEECDQPCSGDKGQKCGGGNRLEVYHKEEVADPIVLQIVNDTWNYQGCYTDNVVNRTLQTLVRINGGATLQTCVAACTSNEYAIAGYGYTYAALEYADECWCGNSIGGASLRPEKECRMACTADKQEFCGGRVRMNLYRNRATTPLYCPKETCTSKTVSEPFTLLAVYRPQPSSGELDATQIGVFAHGALSIGSGDWRQYTIQDGVLRAQSPDGHEQATSYSRSVNSGESPKFGENQCSDYCIVTDPDGNTLLAAKGFSNVWSLCPNKNAGGRMDVIWAPQADKSDYDLSECKAIDIRLQRVETMNF